MLYIGIISNVHDLAVIIKLKKDTYEIEFDTPELPKSGDDFKFFRHKTVWFHTQDKMCRNWFAAVVVPHGILKISLKYLLHIFHSLTAGLIACLIADDIIVAFWN